MSSSSRAKKIRVDAAAWDVFATHQPYYHILCHPSMLDPDATKIADFWASGDRDIETLRSFAGLAPVSGIGVDLGCGLGRLTRALRALTSSQIGLDISAEMIRQARENNCDYPTVEFRRLAGGPWPVKSGTVSLVISLHVLQHMSSPELMEQSIAEMGRVLKPGGWAVLNVPTMTWRGEAIARVKSIVRRLRPTENTNLGQLERRLAGFADTGQGGFTEQEIMGEMFQLDARRMKSLPLRCLQRACRRAGLLLYRIDRKIACSTLVAAEKK